MRGWFFHPSVMYGFAVVVALAMSAASIARAQAVENVSSDDVVSTPTDPATDPLMDRARRVAQRRPTPDIATSPAVTASPIAATASAVEAPAAAPESTDTKDTAATESLKLGQPRQSRGLLLESGEQPGASGNWVLNTVTALGVVILLIWGCRMMLLRMNGHRAAPGSHAAVHVLARVAMTPRTNLLLVRLGDRVLVLGEGSGGLNTLASIDDANEVASLLASVTASEPNSISRSFSHLLHRVQGGMDESTTSVETADPADDQLERARSEVSGLLARVRAMSREDRP